MDNNNNKCNMNRPDSLNYAKQKLNNNRMNSGLNSSVTSRSFDSKHCTFDEMSDLNNNNNNNKSKKSEFIFYPSYKKSKKNNSGDETAAAVDDFNDVDDDDENININNNNNNNKEEEDESESEDENSNNEALYPGYVPIALKYFNQETKPRIWCLQMITSPWFERISMFIIIVNCITLGMYQPCTDNQKCTSTRCYILEYLDHLIHIFFMFEMFVKIMAMGFYGKDTYLAETWNRLDFFIVIAG
jgi:hypothetical protein